MDHIESVAKLLRDDGEERPSVLAAAYLHDTLEKTDTDIAELLREFGEQIAELVYWITDPEDSEGPEKALLSAWLLARAPLEAKHIKLAEIIDNAAAIRVHDAERWPRFAKNKARILDCMARVEGERWTALPLYQAARAAIGRTP
jgi:(p)ppGpp synthase/HD superfamily hydrolase